MGQVTLQNTPGKTFRISLQALSTAKCGGREWLLLELKNILITVFIPVFCSETKEYPTATEKSFQFSAAQFFSFHNVGVVLDLDYIG